MENKNNINKIILNKTFLLIYIYLLRFETIKKLRNEKKLYYNWRNGWHR